MKRIQKLFGFNSSPEPEFLRFKAIAGDLILKNIDSPNAQFIQSILKQDPKEVSWDDIHAGQLALVSFMPLGLLKHKYSTLVEEYQTIIGESPIQATSTTDLLTEEELRARIIALTDDLTKFRRAKLMFERSRSTLGFIFGFVLVAVIAVACFCVQAGVAVHLWVLILVAGGVGAGFSVLSRLYALKWSTRLGSQVDDIKAVTKGLASDCLLSICQGTIAAGVLCLLFTSRLVSGDLFPSFFEVKLSQEICDQCKLMEFFNSQPKTVFDFGKLFAWAFIAGFSERLVPGKLNTLSGEAAKEKANAS